jgi:hypothetical protein
MEPNSAAEHLQTIRTLMERSALYRRALAPIMTFAGAMGCLAAAIGCISNIQSARAFAVFWLGVAFVGLIGAFLLVRRQALKSDEPFWSPPTKRVAHALLPAFLTGFFVGVFVLFCSPLESGDDATEVIALPGIWAVFYGCGLHAAGFFTLRGLRLFGWIVLSGGLLSLLVLSIADVKTVWQTSHLIMGGLFGGLQLVYGAYLFKTGEKRNDL